MECHDNGVNLPNEFRSKQSSPVQSLGYGMYQLYDVTVGINQQDTKPIALQCTPCCPAQPAPPTRCCPLGTKSRENPDVIMIVTKQDGSLSPYPSSHTNQPGGTEDPALTTENQWEGEQPVKPVTTENQWEGEQPVQPVPSCHVTAVTSDSLCDPSSESLSTESPETIHNGVAPESDSSDSSFYTGEVSSPAQDDDNSSDHTYYDFSSSEGSEESTPMPATLEASDGTSIQSEQHCDSPPQPGSSQNTSNHSQSANSRNSCCIGMIVLLAVAVVAVVIVVSLVLALNHGSYDLTPHSNRATTAIAKKTSTALIVLSGPPNPPQKCPIPLPIEPSDYVDLLKLVELRHLEKACTKAARPIQHTSATPTSGAEVTLETQLSNTTHETEEQALPTVLSRRKVYNYSVCYVTDMAPSLTCQPATSSATTCPATDLINNGSMNSTNLHSKSNPQAASNTAPWNTLSAYLLPVVWQPTTITSVPFLSDPSTKAPTILWGNKPVRPPDPQVNSRAHSNATSKSDIPDLESTSFLFHPGLFAMSIRSLRSLWNVVMCLWLRVKKYTRQESSSRRIPSSDSAPSSSDGPTDRGTPQFNGSLLGNSNSVGSKGDPPSSSALDTPAVPGGESSSALDTPAVPRSSGESSSSLETPAVPRSSSESFSVLDTPAVPGGESSPKQGLPAYPPASTSEQEGCGVSKVYDQDDEIKPDDTSGSDFCPSSANTSSRQEDVHDQDGEMKPDKGRGRGGDCHDDCVRGDKSSNDEDQTEASDQQDEKIRCNSTETKDSGIGRSQSASALSQPGSPPQLREQVDDETSTPLLPDPSYISLGSGNSTEDTTDDAPPPCVGEDEECNKPCEQCIVLNGPKCDPCISSDPQDTSESTTHSHEKASCTVSSAIVSHLTQPSAMNTSDGSDSLSQDGEHTAQHNPDSTTRVADLSHSNSTCSECELPSPPLASTSEQEGCGVSEVLHQDGEIKPGNSSGSDYTPSSTNTSSRRDVHDRDDQTKPDKGRGRDRHDDRESGDKSSGDEDQTKVFDQQEERIRCNPTETKDCGIGKSLSAAALSQPGSPPHTEVVNSSHENATCSNCELSSADFSPRVAIALLNRKGVEYVGFMTEMAR